MRTSIIFSDGIKQIVFTPENESEKFALKLITSDDNIELALKEGSFQSPYDPKPFAASIDKCQGGYLRVFNSADSIMLVLTPKKQSK